MPKRKTHEEYMLEIQNKFPQLELLSQYKNAKTNVTFKCKNCNNTFSITPDILARNYNNNSYIPCPYCSGRILNNKTFLQKMKSKSNFSVLSEYHGITNNVKCKCNICKYEWEEIAKNVVERNYCPKCKKKARIKPLDEVLEELNNRNPNVIVEINKSEYIGNNSEITCKCQKCNYSWNTTIQAFTHSKSYCHRCINKVRRTPEEFIHELSKLHKYIKPLETFSTVNHKMNFQCLQCGCIWKAKPNNILTGEKSGCPKCNLSKGEKRIEEVLKREKIHYKWQKEYDGLIGVNGGNLSYDFFLPSFNCLIEYQGEFHDGTAKHQSSQKFIKQQEHDKRKREYAKNHNINLLEIWYWDFDNIEKIIKDNFSN